jgi:hypothetical protein
VSERVSERERVCVCAQTLHNCVSSQKPVMFPSIFAYAFHPGRVLKLQQLGDKHVTAHRDCGRWVHRVHSAVGTRNTFKCDFNWEELGLVQGASQHIHTLTFHAKVKLSL